MTRLDETLQESEDDPADREVDKMLEMLEQVYDLNSWELGFVENVSDQWTRTRFVTETQREKLKEICERNCY